MELILIILAGILMGAFNFGFFCLGYFVRSKKPEDNSVTITEQNKETIRNIAEWLNYKG